MFVGCLYNRDYSTFVVDEKGDLSFGFSHIRKGPGKCITGRAALPLLRDITCFVGPPNTDGLRDEESNIQV